MSDNTFSDAPEFGGGRVKKRSRLLPLLALVIVASIFVVKVGSTDPELRYGRVASTEQLPEGFRNLVLVSRVENADKPTEAGQGEEYRLSLGRENTGGWELHFRCFTQSGVFFDVTESEFRGDGESGQNEAADTIRKLLENVGRGDDVSPEVRERVLSEALTPLSALVAIRAVSDVFSDSNGSNEEGERSGSGIAAFSIGLYLFTVLADMVLLQDFPRILFAQLATLLGLILYSLVPGVLGLIYRRSFGRWFMTAFLTLGVLKWVLSLLGYGFISSEVRNALHLSWSEPLFKVLEQQALLVILALGLRRHSVAAIDHAVRKRAIWCSIALLAAALAGSISFAQELGLKTLWSPNHWLAIEGLVAVLLVIYALLRQSNTGPNLQPRNIVVCLDGTWNEPGQRDFGELTSTNVLKLFHALEGSAPKTKYNASQTKQLGGSGSSGGQIAFYYRGLGNKRENSEIGQLFGGAFGLGATAMVERAYLDIARVYRPGDRIFLFGFSRGAAIARLLAGAIGWRSVPTSLWTLRLFGTHWPVWKSSKRLEENVEVDVLGCWDTVGSFGIAKNILGIPFQRINLLKNLDVSLCVRRAYHMVALDETRDSFVPTLMEPDLIRRERIVELWFSGNHANVGGGYATDKLSNITLDFLLRRISSGYAHEDGMRPGDRAWGLYLGAVKKGVRVDARNPHWIEIDPDVSGQLRSSTGIAYSHAPRKLPLHAVIADTVFERMESALPVYAPQSLFDLNSKIIDAQKHFTEEVDKLVETKSLFEDEFEPMKEWGERHLTLTRWSEYLEFRPKGAPPIKDLLDPPRELANDRSDDPA